MLWIFWAYFSKSDKVDFTVYHFQLFSNSNNSEANDGLQLWSDYTDFIYDKYLEFYLGSCLPAVLSRCIGRQCWYCDIATI